MALLEVGKLVKHFPLRGRRFGSRGTVPKVHAVDGISFAVEENETLGLVGESGSGKSTTGRLVLRLIEPTDGKVLFRGENLLDYDEKELRQFRQHGQIIFQDPYSALNPRLTVEQLISEPQILAGVPKRDRKARCADLLSRIGLDQQFAGRYPHELSGGQRQRVALAAAFAMNPRLIVADEPVSAQDVSIQAQLLNLMMDLKDEFRISYLFISHDLSVVRHISDRVAVMYLGEIVEMASKDELFERPAHPYTQALMSAIPRSNPKERWEPIVLKGEIPSPVNPPKGCRFHTRCFMAEERCYVEHPELRTIGEGHLVACHFAKP